MPASTLRSAVAVPLLPKSEVKSPVVLLCIPMVLLVTSTLIWQLLDAGTEPLVTVILVPFVTILVAASQLLVIFGAAAIVTSAGKLSTNAKLLAVAVDALLSMLNVKIEVLPGFMMAGAKTLLNNGAGLITMAVEAELASPILVVIIEVTLVNAPVAVAITSTLMAQLALALTVPPA